MHVWFSDILLYLIQAYFHIPNKLKLKKNQDNKVSLLGHSPLTYALLLHMDLSLNQITELPHDVFFNVTKLKTL